MKVVRSVLLMVVLLSPLLTSAAEALGASSLQNVTRVRVALVPDGVAFRIGLTETTVWTSACVYESEAPAAIVSLLHLLTSTPQPAPMAAGAFLIRHAIELTAFDQTLRMVLSDWMTEPGRPAFLRGRWRGADRLSVREFETATIVVDQLRGWVRQPGVRLVDGSPGECR